MRLPQRCTDKPVCLCPPGLCCGWQTWGLCFCCSLSFIWSYSCECTSLCVACTSCSQDSYTPWPLPVLFPQLLFSLCMAGYLIWLFKCNPNKSPCQCFFTVTAGSEILLPMMCLKIHLQIRLAATVHIGKHLFGCTSFNSFQCCMECSKWYNIALFCISLDVVCSILFLLGETLHRDFYWQIIQQKVVSCRFRWLMDISWKVEVKGRMGKIG